MSEVWEKLPTESNKAYALFCLYRDMGPARSLLKLLKSYPENSPKVGRRQLVNYCSRYNWVSRANAFDLAMEKQKRMAMQNAVEELARKQVERGRALAEEGMKYLKNPKRKPLTPAEARMYITDGSELERLGYGLTDERRQREPHTIQVIISAPRPGKPISEAPQRRELPAGDTTNEKVLEAEVVEVNTEEFA